MVNVHGGGAYGDKAKALGDFARNLGRLSPRARVRLTVENDDKIFTPADLLPLCRAEGLPLVYDVHHHRCHRDELSEGEVTEEAVPPGIGNRSFTSPARSRGGRDRSPNGTTTSSTSNDFPESWRDRDLTVEVEAKAKEIAVLKLRKELPERTSGASS